MTDPVRPRNIFFPLTVFCSGLFVVTILAHIAALFGDPQAPAAQLLDRSANWLFGAEVAGILSTGLAALVVDRRQTLAAQVVAAMADSELQERHEAEHPGGN